MNRPEQVIATTVRVLRAEAAALTVAADQVDERWVQAVELLAACTGKVIIFGIGKTGHVGRKIAASLSSLGTPSFFLHAAEAAHGDLGVVTPTDIVVAISNSGETVEVVSRLSYFAELGCTVIALTRSAQSTLGRAATICLELPSEGEADLNNLAPTVSSTLALAAGDALAVAVAEVKGFSRNDFGKRHPGGALGKIANG